MQEQFIVVREKRADESGNSEFHLAQIEALQKELAKSQARVLELERVTRIEVISKSQGRLYVNREASFDEVQLQDDNQTLKIFIN